MNCPICSVSCASVGGFLHHVTQHQCGYCPIKYHFLPNHVYACDNAMQIATSCKLCSSSFVSVADLVRHYSEKFCEKCSLCTCKCEGKCKTNKK